MIYLTCPDDTEQCQSSQKGASSQPYVEWLAAAKPGDAKNTAHHCAIVLDLQDSVSDSQVRVAKANHAI